MKVAAKKAQRKHYWMIVVICLFASVFGVAYASSTLSVNINISVSTPQTEDSTQSNDMYGVLRDLAIGNEDSAREKVKQNQEQIVNNDTDAMFGRRRGVIASLLNSFASGSLVVAIVDAVNSVIHNGGISIAVLIILSFAVYIFHLAVHSGNVSRRHDAHAVGRTILRQTAGIALPLPHPHARMASDSLDHVRGKRVPVPLEPYHHRFLHQTVFLPYGAVYHCGESKHQSLRRYSPVPTYDGRA